MQGHEPTHEAIKEALEVVLISAHFTRSAKQATFLRFVVERNLDNVDQPPSSFEIAIDCFKRSPPDPNDAYVRNIASQTRKSLKSYYHTLLQTPDVVIKLAEKGYLVTCHLNTADATCTKQQLSIPSPATAKKGTHKLLPTIAVIPLRCVSGDSEHAVLGHMLSDSLITSLAKSKYMRVISRRTSTQFSLSNHSTIQLGEILNADYLVDGKLYVHGGALRVQVELSCCSNDEVIWAEKLHSEVEAVVNETDELVEQMLYGITSQLLNHELQRALSMPLASLKCHSLLIGGVNIMHRSTPADIRRAREMFELLSKRNPLHATPAAQLAYWGLLNIIRDASNQATNINNQFVLEHTHRALALDSLHPVALTALGMAKSHFDKDFSSGFFFLEQALMNSPNEAAPMGRMAIAKLYTDSPNSALEMAKTAIRTSPLDPELYFFQTAAAFASFAGEDFKSAARYAEKSFETFPNHPSNLRILVGAYSALNDTKNMLKAKKSLLVAMPEFNLESYLKSTPSPQHRVIQQLVTHLGNANLPATRQ